MFTGICRIAAVEAEAYTKKKLSFCIEMEMNFGVVSSSYEIPCPHSWSSRLTNGKSFISKHSAGFGCFNEKHHHRLRNCDAGRVMISQPLMPGHIQESYMGRRHLEEEVVSGSKLVRTLLIDNYDSYTYNIFQELATINGGTLCFFFVICVQLRTGIYRQRDPVLYSGYYYYYYGPLVGTLK